MEPSNGIEGKGGAQGSAGEGEEEIARKNFVQTPLNLHETIDTGCMGAEQWNRG